MSSYVHAFFSHHARGQSLKIFDDDDDGGARIRI